MSTKNELPADMPPEEVTEKNQLTDKPYLTTREVCTLLGISRATFYRLYYDILTNDPTSRSRNGRYMYRPDRVLAVLKPLSMPEVATRKSEASERSNRRQTVVEAKAARLNRRRPRVSQDDAGQLSLFNGG